MINVKKKYFIFISILVAMLTAGYFFLVRTVMPDYIKQSLPRLEALAAEYINGSVRIGGMRWDGGLSAELDDVVILDAEKQKVAELPKTVLYLRPWLAIDNPAKALSRIVLQEPVAYLAMDDNEQWNMQHLLKPSDSEEVPFYGLLQVAGGKLHVTMPQGKWDFGVDGDVSGGANPNFAVDMNLQAGADALSLKGLITTKGEGRLQLSGEKLALAPYKTLAEHYANIRESDGSLEKLAILYDNKNGETRFSGNVSLAAVSGKFLAGDEHSFQLDGEVKAADSVISIPGLAILADGQTLELKGEADLRDTSAITGKGTLSAKQLAYKGYEASNLKLQLEADKQSIQLKTAQIEYGGGKIQLHGFYDLEDKLFTGDANADNVRHMLTDDQSDGVTLNGQFAVNARADGDGVVFDAAADTMALSWRSLTVDRMSMDGFYDGKDLTISNFSAFADKGSLAASGVIGNDGALALKGRLADFPVHPLLDIASGQQASGLYSTGFAIGGTIAAPEFSGTIQLKDVEFMEQKIKEAHGAVSLKNNMLELKHFVANMEQGQHLLDGTINLQGEDPEVDLSLETIGVRIEPLMRLIAPDVSVTGNLDNIMQVRGTISHPFVYGEVHASDGSAMKQLFNGVEGRYSYEDGRLKLQDFEINAFIAKAVLNGTMTKDQHLDFTLDAQNIDLAHLPIADDDVSLDGLLNANGHLGGTLLSPVFEGNVDSEQIAVNGEALTELQGTLVSNGKENNLLSASFKQPYKADPTNYGLFTADINLNLVDKYMQGKILAMWGDIGGLLRMNKLDYDINGYMQGEIDCNPQGKGSGINIKVRADNVKIHDLNYNEACFYGRLHKGVFYFDDVRLQEQAGAKDSGIIAVGGQIDLIKEQYGVEVGAVKANPAIVTALMKDPPEVKGQMDMLVQLSGSFANPEGYGSLEVAQGSIAGIGIDGMVAMLALKDDHIQLQQLIANKDAYSIKADGDIPLDLFRDKASRHNPNAQLDIKLDVNEANLGVLPVLTPMVEWGVGDTQGEIKLAGTLEEPLLFGNVKIDDGNVKVKYLDTVLENIHLDVDLQGNKVQLKDLSAKLGKGSLAANGSYAINTDADTAYRLEAVAKDAQLASTIFTGTINGNIAIAPQEYPDFQNKQSDGGPTMAYRPKISGAVRLDDVLVNMPTVPELGEGSSNFGLDIALELGPKIHLYNSYLYDIWLIGGVHVKGSTNYPIIEGTVKADKGSITYLRTNFKLDKAGLVWVNQGSFLPNVNLEAAARFSRYNIFMKINGPVEGMDLQLTSNPPLEQNTIIRMLTLQRDSAGSNEVTSEDMANLMTVGLQMTVLGDVEMLVKQTLGLDQFRIYTGKVRSGVGFESAKNRTQELTQDERNQYNVLVSKYITNKFMVGYTTSFDGIDRSIFGQYDISKHMNITYSRNYDLSKEAEDWWGVEYKVSF